LSKQRKGFHEDESGRIAYRDTRASDVAGDKIRESEYLAGDAGVVGPRPLRPIEDEVAERVAMIELFELCPAVFSPKAKLVFARRERNDVGQVRCDVFAAFRWRQADFVEAGDGDVGCAS